MASLTAVLRYSGMVGQPTARSERVLAVGRAFLTVTGLAAIYLDPNEPARFASLTYAVLVAYASYSMLVLLVVSRLGRPTSRHVLTLHVLDIVWASLLTFVSDGPVSPYFLFLQFSVLAAAYRWGFRATLSTALLTMSVFLAETGAATTGILSALGMPPIEFDLSRTILRVAYTLLIAFLFGYLAEQEKRSRAELTAIADTARLPRVSLGLGGSVTAVARSLVSIFDANSVAIVLQDHETGRTLLWRVDRTAGVVSPGRRFELDEAGQSAWLFETPGHAWHVNIGGGRNGATVGHATAADAWPLRAVELNWPRSIADPERMSSVLAVDTGLPREWRGRIYVFDADHIGSVAQAVHFLESIAEHVVPALTNVFLLRRLRARAGAAERSRVARELHDGTIQALFGVEMKLEALRRSAVTDAPAMVSRLDEVQELVRQEVLGLRELMQALKPIELDAGDQLADVLSTVVERFRRDTGVSARCVSTGGPIALTPATTAEIVKIVQEVLVNVRKHSRAKNVVVRLTREGRAFTVVIEDDGCGFSFKGRLSGDELNRRRLGPAVIRERARLVNAVLVVESTPGEGSRVELTFGELQHV